MSNSYVCYRSNLFLLTTSCFFSFAIFSVSLYFRSPCTRIIFLIRNSPPPPPPPLSCYKFYKVNVSLYKQDECCNQTYPATSSLLTHWHHHTYSSARRPQHMLLQLPGPRGGGVGGGPLLPLQWLWGCRQRRRRGPRPLPRRQRPAGSLICDNVGG